MVIIYLAIACGFGALVRYFFSQYNQSSKLPLGTLIANLLGCFLIGLLYNHVDSKEVYAILATGFCGGLTTFSTLNDELQRLLSDKKVFYSYLFLTYIGGFLAIFLAAMLGGLVRYFVSSQLPASPDFPWGTLLVNYLGIFCLVYLVKGYLVYKGSSKGLVLALGTGFCGGLTTFSSLLLDAVKLLDTERYLSLGIYLLLSIGGGLLLAYVLGRKKW